MCCLRTPASQQYCLVLLLASRVEELQLLDVPGENCWGTGRYWVALADNTFCQEGQRAQLRGWCLGGPAGKHRGVRVGRHHR